MTLTPVGPEREEIRASGYPSSIIYCSRFGAGVLAACLLACALGACSTQPRTTVAAAAPAVYGPPPAPASYVVATEAAPLKPQVKTAAVTFDQTKPYKIAGQTYTPKPGHAAGQGATGLASYYGEGFQGRRTANGETFDMHGFTAAHPSLPLPSYVRVTNVSNGRSIVVRVNDRGPYHKGRMLDVSQRTADVLGFRRAGVGNVRVDYIGPASAGGREDRTLLATYQEFGRPGAPEGMQVAGLTPVSDAALVARAQGGTATLVASATPVAATRAVVGPTVSAYASERPLAGVTTTIQRPAPTLSNAALAAAVSGPAAKPSPIAVAAKAPAKRVVQPAEPALASVTPVAPAHAAPAPAPIVVAAETPKASVDASARVAASFEDFGAFRGSIGAPGEGAFNGIR